jgi:hypothetical protein
MKFYLKKRNPVFNNDLLKDKIERIQ